MPERHRSHRAIPPLGIAAWLITVAGVASVLLGVVSPTATEAATTTTTKPKIVSKAIPLPAVPTPTTVAAPQVPTSTLLASPLGTVPYYSGPGGPEAGTVGTWYGYALTLPVINEVPGYLEVRLPWRPNESVGWLADANVTLSSTPYRIQINLTTMHLTLFKAGYSIGSFPVGIGVPATPTTPGEFFVAVKEIDPGPGYGPFALDTSAHSTTIQSWEGTGDAIEAIHGPIDSYADALIGTTGARVSNGCIRMHLADQAQLSMVEPGTPIDILAG
ncbi:MAG: L,D-transpeptidase [Acidimicrobiales bacterium]